MMENGPENTTTLPDKPPFEEWAILEMMGHVRIAGKVTEEERFGGMMGRIDIPDADGGYITQYFGSRAIFRLTPTTEEIARSIASRAEAAPISLWEFPQLNQGRVGEVSYDDGETPFSYDDPGDDVPFDDVPF